jgi:hypothetical protein
MNKKVIFTLFLCFYSIMSFAQIYNQAGSKIYFTKGDKVYFKNENIVNSGTMYVDSSTIYTNGNITNTIDTAIIDNTNSNIVLEGDSTQDITMNGSSFDSLTINKGLGSKAKINGNTTVVGNINMMNGFLVVEDVNDTLRLTSTATVTGESDNHYIKGNLENTKIINGNSSNFGGIGLTIDASPNNVNLGSIVVTRIAGNNLPIASSGYTSIDRVWKIEPSIQPTDSILLTLQWLPDNDNGVNLSEANVWYTVDEGVTWQAYKDTFDASVSRSITFGIDHFSYWTVGGTGLPFPINLMNLKATLLPNQKGLIEWATSSEINNDYFEVEKMEGFNHFAVLGKVDGAGNSTKTTNYSLIDNNVVIGTNYYRLKQTDFDGRFTYSDVVSLYKNNERIVLMYPNPATTSVTINISEVSSISPAEITFINSLGQQVKKITTITNNNDIELSDLASGNYVIAINMKQKVSYHKLVKD